MGKRDLKEPERAAISASDYNEVIASAHLLDVKMIQSDFLVKVGFFATEEAERRYVFGCDQGPTHFSEGRLIGTFKVEAGIKRSREFILRAKATYIIAFAIDGEVTEEASLAYLRRVGSFACWPYFRANFAQLCAAAGAEVAPLPVMKGNLPTEVK